MATTKTNTAAATTTATSDKAMLTAFNEWLTGWQKQAGPAPTATHLRQATSLGLRVGSKKAFAAAMYLRADGATQGQVLIALGGPQLNVLREAVAAKVATRVNVPARNGHTVYKMALPAKGKGKAAAKGKGKAAAKGKGSKAAAVKADQPAS